VKELPLNLARLRKKKKLSQRQLSKRAGVSRSYISELESFKYDPSKVICKLCIALECTPSELLTGWEREE
jgi:transcriptional regulator with XRE-family HTH domain